MVPSGREPDDADLATQRWLFAVGLLAAITLVYASIVPLRFQPLAWTDALDRFRTIPWLHLGIYHRADWVANGLVALPFGFLLAGGADRDRRLTWRYALSLVGIIVFGCSLIVGIEFIQVWFPPRTVSLNDIAAGCVGAVIGPFLWPFIGRPAISVWSRLRHGTSAQWPPHRVARVAMVTFGLLLLAYSVMPLDVMFRVEEWQTKWQAGRLSWIPDTSRLFDDAGNLSFDGLVRYLMVFAISTARIVPLGFLVYFSRLGRSGFGLLISFPLLIELLQSAIFTRYATFSDVLCGWVGGIVGLLLAMTLPALLHWNDRRDVRWTMVVAMLVLIPIAFLGRYERFATPDEIVDGWSAFWQAPFVKYYFTSEFSAGSNAAGKVLVFAGLGFLFANLCSQSGQRRVAPKWSIVVLCAITILSLGFAIEVAQVYMVPMLGDASDVLLYGGGGVIGWAAYRTLVTWRFAEEIREGN